MKNGRWEMAATTVFPATEAQRTILTPLRWKVIHRALLAYMAVVGRSAPARRILAIFEEMSRSVFDTCGLIHPEQYKSFGICSGAFSTEQQ